MEDIVGDFDGIDCYWHTPDVLGKGLAYCGVTLIPPYSVGGFLDIIKGVEVLDELRKLCEKALAENKWIIHFGL